MFRQLFLGLVLMASPLCSASDFWAKPAIVEAYTDGGNAAQVARFYQARDWLAQHPICPGELLVDVGCGPAEITTLFAMCNAGGSVLGVDNSPAMIRAGHRNIKLSGVSNVQIWNCDALDLQLPARLGSVDRFISFTAIHWFPDVGPFFAGVEAYLKKDGLFFFRYAGCKGDETLELAEELRQESQWVERFEGFENPMYSYPIGRMREESARVGLTIERAEIWENIEVFPDRAEYEAYVQGWLPHLYHLQPADRKVFLKELADRHVETEGRLMPTGEVAVHDFQILISGRK